MRNNDILPRISEMSYEDLLKKVERIRAARVDARSAAASKPVRKSREKKSSLEKLFSKMSPDEKKKFMEALGE